MSNHSRGQKATKLLLSILLRQSIVVLQKLQDKQISEDGRLKERNMNL